MPFHLLMDLQAQGAKYFKYKKLFLVLQRVYVLLFLHYLCLHSYSTEIHNHPQEWVAALPMTWEEGGQGDGEEEEVDEEEEERERREMEEEEQEEREGRPDNLTLGAEGFHMKSVHFH